MSLDWNITEVRDHKELWIEDEVATKEQGEPRYRLDGATETLIFLAPTIKMHKITEQNAGEWYARIKVYEGAFGPSMRKSNGEGVTMTPEMIVRRIGMRTNVREESRTKFFKTLHWTMDEDAREVRKLLESQREEAKVA